jgi:hypothetical protein
MPPPASVHRAVAAGNLRQTPRGHFNQARIRCDERKRSCAVPS